MTRASSRPDTAAAAGTQTAVLLLARMKRGARLWGLMRLVIGRFALRRVPGLVFFKVLGSGDQGGFGLKPSADRLGLFVLFADAGSADQFVSDSGVVRAWRSRAIESAWLQLGCYSARGAWARQTLVPRCDAPLAGPIAVLTRASIRPRCALAFWRRSPAAEHALHATPGCLLATGLGEAPLLRQATFSVWQDGTSVDAYAKQGPHLDAARAAYEHCWFSESLFARFVVLSQGGAWQGRALG